MPALVDSCWVNGCWTDDSWAADTWVAAGEGGGDPGSPSAPARTYRVRSKGSIKWAFLLMAGTALTNV